jgi:hypothetical protein
MRVDSVVFFKPMLSDFPNFSQGTEQIGIQHVFPKGAVEAFNVSVLSWFAWVNVSNTGHFFILFRRILSDCSL